MAIRSTDSLLWSCAPDAPALSRCHLAVHKPTWIDWLYWNGIVVVVVVAAFGRAYRGKIAPFGEYVYALKEPEKKTKAPWCGGIYLTKTRNDPHMIGLEDGVMRAGAISRIGAGWRVEPVMRLTCTPWNILKPKGKFNPPVLAEASMPALRNEEEATKPTVEIEDRNR